MNFSSPQYVYIWHTALFCPNWRQIENFCTFFKDLKALLQISLTKHNHLSHLLPFATILDVVHAKKSIFVDFGNFRVKNLKLYQPKKIFFVWNTLKTAKNRAISSLCSVSQSWKKSNIVSNLSLIWKLSLFENIQSSVCNRHIIY